MTISSDHLSLPVSSLRVYCHPYCFARCFPGLCLFLYRSRTVEIILISCISFDEHSKILSADEDDHDPAFKAQILDPAASAVYDVSNPEFNDLVFRFSEGDKLHSVEHYRSSGRPPSCVA